MGRYLQHHTGFAQKKCFYCKIESQKFQVVTGITHNPLAIPLYMLCLMH